MLAGSVLPHLLVVRGGLSLPSAGTGAYLLVNQITSYVRAGAVFVLPSTPSESQPLYVHSGGQELGK